ncbi:ABC transporter permease [Sphingomonas sp. RB56-2]|uniref:ABC transporter permease n=1 Tax=Sphingomonas brevis TaxID=2908206 RepID=A0ABT0S904_9SPHN|nr:ABC transporter permease [Sphingomonas brevis]MCL6740868.1 ABC transporter permease [Sphingomonas brevis]
MWRNYWTVAVRALAKSKTYSIINIAGLAIGMAACIMILLYIRYEQSYDEWLPDVENTYQLQTWGPNPSDGEPFFFQMASYTTKDRIKKDFPQVQSAAYIQDNGPVFIKDGQATSTEDFMFTDDDFLKVVSLPLLTGTTLTQPQTAVITQSEAIKRYGTDRVLGQTLTVISRGLKRDFKINGVIKDLPKNSSLKINAIMRLDYQAFNVANPQFLTCWGCQSGWVYLKVKPGTDIKLMQGQMGAWEKRNIPDEPVGDIRYNAGDDQEWHFINLKDIHLGKAQDSGMTPGNDRRTITTFGIIAMLILAMAVVNFTNLATARAGQRAREVALRKVLGANRKQLIVQFVGESLLISAASMLLALALAELLVHPFAAFLDADIRLNYLGRDGILLPAIGLTLMVGIVSGLYPAFFLSRFQPAQVLKANRSAAETPGSGYLRTALVVLQFAVSIGLIICTAVIYGQTVYARSADPGYKRDHILQVEEMARAQLWPLAEGIVDRTKRIPGVVAAGLTDIGINTNNNNNNFIIPPGSKKQILIGQYNVGEGFMDAMGLKLIAGRWFDANREIDDATTPYPPDPAIEQAIHDRGMNVVLNQYAVRKLGFKSPQDAIGKVVKGDMVGNDLGLMDVTIIGVVGDSRFRTVRTPIDPIIFRKVRTGPSWMMVRYNGDPNAVKDAIEREWKQVTNDVPFNAKFSEDVMGEAYEQEDARAQMFAAFSILAVIIGCLGLFGLAAFTAERRTKEIGIRKVLGARTRDIVRLLVWQFSRPVIVANVIAWPVAWWLMRDWLNKFDDRIALGPTPFVTAAVIALTIAIVTVVGHAFKVARANPIHALRYE